MSSETLNEQDEKSIIWSMTDLYNHSISVVNNMSAINYAMDVFSN